VNGRWTLAGRVFGTLLLLCVVVGLAVRFGHLQATPDPATKHFPGGAALAADYSALIGSQVELYGSVVATDPVVVEGTYGGRKLTVTVASVQTNPNVGEYLHVFGVVEPGGTVRAIDTVVYPATGITLTYALSALAGLWTMVRFINRWQFSFADASFSPRSSSRISVPKLIPDRRAGGSDDA
jgi:hypothetical protein